MYFFFSVFPQILVLISCRWLSLVLCTYYSKCRIACASFRSLLLKCIFLSSFLIILPTPNKVTAETSSYRRRSDWNSGGDAWRDLLWKSCCRGKKYIFIHCNASNLVLKIFIHDKIWGTVPPLQILGRGACSPVPPWCTPMLPVSRINW